MESDTVTVTMPMEYIRKYWWSLESDIVTVPMPTECIHKKILMESDIVAVPMLTECIQSGICLPGSLCTSLIQKLSYKAGTILSPLVDEETEFMKMKLYA